MPFPNEHSVRIHAPTGYKRYRRKNLTGGVDAIIGFKKGGGSEIQALRFDKKKFTPAEAESWTHKHGYKHPVSVTPAKKSEDHMSVGDVVVRQSLVTKDTDKKDFKEDISITYGTVYGQSGPGEGMGYIKTPTMDASNPQDDIPAGNGDRVLAMPQPRVADPKGSLTNIIPDQTPRIDDPKTLSEEDVTYGDWDSLARHDDKGPGKARYELQRSVPSAYTDVV